MSHVTWMSCVHVTCNVLMSHSNSQDISFYKSEYWITLDNMQYYKCLLKLGKNQGFCQFPSKYRCLGLIDRIMLETWNFFWWLRSLKCSQKNRETYKFQIFMKSRTPYSPPPFLRACITCITITKKCGPPPKNNTRSGSCSACSPLWIVPGELEPWPGFRGKGDSGMPQP